MSRNSVLILEDIVKSCVKVLRFTEGRSKIQVFEEDLRADAVLLNLHVIGEAVKNLPGELCERYPDVAWREITGLRDFIAHAYFALESDIIWDAVERDVPALLDAVRRIIRAESPAGD